RWEEPAEFVRHDRLDEFGGDRGDWDRMRFSILCLGPVDDPFLGVPLVNMEGSDFFDALASQRQNANSARVGWMDGRIRAFEPSSRANSSSLSQRTPTTFGSVGIPAAGLCTSLKRRGDALR